MSNKMNVIVNINAYNDEKNSMVPSMNNVKWNREILGADIYEPESKSIRLAAGQSLNLFSGSVATSDDATTTFDIALKEGCSNVYKIAHNSGTAPLFRQPRVSGADATTEVTVTKNASLATYTSTGGTLFNLVTNSVQIGDIVRVEGDFNDSNAGTFVIVAFDATSFTVENESGQAEGPIVLGVDFLKNINIYSTDGVQVGDKLEIVAGFSSVSYGTYDIVEVSHDFVTIYSNKALPEELNVSNATNIFSIYRDAKQFIYIESDKKLSIILNESLTPNEIIPFQVGSTQKPGIFMTQSSIRSCTIENKTTVVASVFFISAE